MKFELSGGLVEPEIEAVIIAGFTGRDQGQVQAHIAELAAEGITVPDRVPSFYLAPPNILEQTGSIVTVHDYTSGEAEIALICVGDEIYVTLASDHTDRAAEALDIAISKLACPKVIASTAWPFEDVQSRWDSLVIRSWINEGGRRVKYQEGPAGTLLAPVDLLAKTPFRRRPESFVLLTGTLPAAGGIRGSDHFWAELHDPGLDRSIQLDYAIQVIGDVLEPAI